MMIDMDIIITDWYLSWCILYTSITNCTVVQCGRQLFIVLIVVRLNEIIAAYSIEDFLLTPFSSSMIEVIRIISASIPFYAF